MRLRTIAISECYHQEAKRRFRPGRGFGSERNLQALVRLPVPQHNCLIDRIDRLEYAARRAGTSPSNRQLHTGMRAASPPHTQKTERNPPCLLG